MTFSLPPWAQLSWQPFWQGWKNTWDKTYKGQEDYEPWNCLLMPLLFSLSNPETFVNFCQSLENPFSLAHQSPSLLLGRDMGLSQGKVVAQTPLVQLIHYTPLRKATLPYGVCLIPPLINKYYIFDLTPSLSLVQFLLHQGFPVFALSWANGNRIAPYTTWEDYLQSLEDVLSVASILLNQHPLHLVSYCISGYLTFTWLTWARTTQSLNSPPVASTTYLAMPAAPSFAPAIKALAHPIFFPWLQLLSRSYGRIDAHMLQWMFRLLRAKELIIDPLVKPKKKSHPSIEAFLAWNNDGMHVPGPLYEKIIVDFFHKKTLQNNSLPLMCRGITLKAPYPHPPTCVVATQRDHIAPPASCYPITQQIYASTTFLLAGAGHVAGIINPPTLGKYNYRRAFRLYNDLETWGQNSTNFTGSWWPTWARWLKKHTPYSLIPSGVVGSHPDFPALEKAPGSYAGVQA